MNYIVCQLNLLKVVVKTQPTDTDTLHGKYLYKHLRVRLSSWVLLSFPFLRLITRNFEHEILITQVLPYRVLLVGFPPAPHPYSLIKAISLNSGLYCGDMEAYGTRCIVNGRKHID